MSEIQTEEKVILKNELYNQFNWFNKSFLASLQRACDEFFPEFFSLRLVSVSNNMNVLFQGDDYFVTKIRINKNHDVFFRSSAGVIKIILDKLFGATANYELAQITELEAKIMSSFNDYLFNSLSLFLATNPNVKSKNVDILHITLFLQDKVSQQAGKVIISLPKVLLSPNPLEVDAPKFDSSDFQTSKIKVNLKVGTTQFSVKDLKNLEKDDIVVFDNSNIHSMNLIYEDYEKSFKVSPNPGLITSVNNNGGNNMTQEKSLSQNLWDNIQIDMSAEFEKVKITLGELKNIEEGLVVDVSSVYNNKISLKVENKVIAKGELVIINDRYGVRVDEVFASERAQAEKITHGPTETEEAVSSEETAPTDGEFDYSDFELDEQDI